MRLCAHKAGLQSRQLGDYDVVQIALMWQTFYAVLQSRHVVGMDCTVGTSVAEVRRGA